MITMNTVNTLMNNTEFMNSLANVKSVEELQALLASEGIEMTAEEIEAALEAAANQNKGELDEADLDNVNGGIVCTILLASAGVTFIASAGKLALTCMTRR